MTTSRKKFTQAQRYLSDAVDDPSKSNGMTSTYDSDNGMLILIGWFNKEPKSLAHECVHAVFKILGLVNVQSDTNNNEAFAYLLGDMFNQFWKKR